MSRAENAVVIDSQFENLDINLEHELYVKRNFCGVVCKDLEDLIVLDESIIYLCGDIESYYQHYV